MKVRVLNRRDAGQLATELLALHKWQKAEESRLINRIRVRLGRPVRYRMRTNPGIRTIP